MQRLFLCGSVALLLFAGANAAPVPEGKLPVAEGKRWADRIGKAVCRDNWTVERKDDELVLRRTKPVAMVREFPNAMPDSKPVTDGERAIRFVLRFGPKISFDEYDRLAAVNEASAKEYDRLRGALNLPHKFDDFLATTPEEKKRLEEFRAATAKLPRHTLPDLYTLDHSVYVLHPWNGWSYPADKDIAAECREVEDVLMRLFGMYSPGAARDRSMGRYLPEPRR